MVLCAGISSHLCFGYSTKKSRETFIGLILLIMLGFQLFHLIRAALYVPATRFSIFNEAFHRSDCLQSNKGTYSTCNKMLSKYKCLLQVYLTRLSFRIHIPLHCTSHLVYLICFHLNHHNTIIYFNHNYVKMSFSTKRKKVDLFTVHTNFLSYQLLLSLLFTLLLSFLFNFS